MLALLAALVGALAVEPAVAKIKRPPGQIMKPIKRKLHKELVGRELDNVEVRLCQYTKRKIRKKWAVHCTWYSEGTLEGEQPYRCHGDSLYGKLPKSKGKRAKGKRAKRKRGWIRISACVNKARIQIPVAPAPVNEPEFGYNDDWYTPASLALLDLFDRVEPDYARFGFDWSVVESSRGDFDFSLYDGFYAELQARGIRPIWTIGAAPCFYQEGACKHPARPSPSHYDEMAKLAAAIARRYPQVGALEVLNEPNTGKYWGGVPEPDQYVKMFLEVEKAVEQANPSVPVLFGSLSPHAEADADTVPAAEFLARGYELGAVQRSDGISTHPYPGTAPGEDHAVAASKRLGDLWKVMSLQGDGDRPLWITETGVSTHGSRAFTPDEQAAALLRSTTSPAASRRCGCSSSIASATRSATTRSSRATAASMRAGIPSPPSARSARRAGSTSADAAS